MKKEIEEILEKLRKKFNNDEVESLGYNRFVIREPYEVKAKGGMIILYKDKMADEQGILIPLQNEYNSIFNFTAGVAVVCLRKNIKIEGGRFTQDRRDGLIDINGKELLPCIYDSIHVHIDSFIEITKDGQKKDTNVGFITSGKFNWDKANNLDC